MAVEASHHTLLHPQMMRTNAIDINNNHVTGFTDSINAFGYGLTNPYCPGFANSINGFASNINNAPLKAESGLTCSLPVSRKRTRESSDLYTFVNSPNMDGATYTFLGEDISMQIHNQQMEIDQIIANHAEKVRMEIEERRKRNSCRLIAAVEEGLSKRLRAKEEEIVKISKLNYALEEKVKSLYVESQIWRELAQSNEATANALRINLKQVLAACVDEAALALAEDAQSCCESNNEENDDCTSKNNNADNHNYMKRMCKKCGNGESCVLLLPCRHLCLCTVCASSVNICPVCKSTKNISVHVNIS